MSWKIYTVKMVNVPKLVYRFNSIPIKILAGFFFFFCKNWKIEAKIHLEIKGPRIAKTILENNNKVEGLPKTDQYLNILIH